MSVPVDPARTAAYVGWLEAQLSDLSACALPKTSRRNLHRQAVLMSGLRKALRRPGRIMEFGCCPGKSLRRMALGAPFRRFAGFDGFPQDEHPDRGVGASDSKTPWMPPNVTLVKGRFSETVPRYLGRMPGPLTMIHIDCDLYAATRDILGALLSMGHLKPGLVIVCDEAINHPEFAWNEMLALWEMMAPIGLTLQPLAVHCEVRSLADTLALVSGGAHPDGHQDQGYRQQAAFTIVPSAKDPPAAASAVVDAFLAATSARLAGSDHS